MEPLLVACPACGATNRVPPDRVARGLAPVCGKCRAPLPVGKPQPVTDASFAQDVERSPLPVLVDAWAPWCGPCHMIAPVIDQLATELAGRVRVVKLNVDDNPRTAARFDLRSIPTLLVLRDGREVDRLVGVQPKQEIARRLERVLQVQ
ncbi:MAG TPA: thioredoxin TrxC [Methylomirabilota bacterium]|jgi:thioredoxin 2|nr:thioredoxin TrxC [Methylomirabilota bacterium]